MRTAQQRGQRCACGQPVMAGGICAACRSRKLARAPGDARQGSGRNAPTIVHEVLRSPGQPLERGIRRAMEARFNHDFSAVRTHAGARAAESARAVGAQAYTVGRDVVFGAGQLDPSTVAGKRLLAHELAHVVQQRALPYHSGPLPLDDRAGPAERQASHLAAATESAPHATPSWTLLPQTVQRQGAAPTAPTGIDLRWTQPAHVPPCGGALEVTTDGTQITWTLEADPTAVDASTTITAVANANPERARIAIGAAQAAGQIAVKADNASGTWRRGFALRSHPTGITSTRIESGPASAADYGAVYEHVFTSADGDVASLLGVAVGERFIGIPNPAGATHIIPPPTHPFGGNFTLETSTLKSDASDNWFLTAAGELGGTHDSVTFSKAGVNVGRFIQSASNTRPARALPADMTLTQGLHWFCPQAPAATRWRTPAFVQVGHSRTLRSRAGTVEFVTTVNGVEQVDAYEGSTGVFNATASPVNTPRSQPAPTAPRTVRITADTLPTALPAGTSLAFSIVGAALGATIAPDPADDHTGILTVGTTAGRITVQIADSTGTNHDRVTVTVT